MRAGYYRVHLVADDGDWITMYVPLDDTGHYDADASKPHLVKTLWQGAYYYGEFLFEGGDRSRFVWETDEDYRTDLLSAPLRNGAIVRIRGPVEAWDFSVRDLRLI